MPDNFRNIDSINTNQRPKAPVVNIANGKSTDKSFSLITAKQKTGPKKILRRILGLIVIIIFILGSFILIRAANLSQKIFVGQKTTFFGKIIDFIRGGGDNGILIGEDLGQINVLVLGIGGEGHEGPYLTDTMILAQIRPDIGEITLTSIPRDYLVSLPQGGGLDKINSAFTYGYTKNKDWDEGGRWARQVVENISGLKVPYFAVVDFSGFEKAVDQVGGLDIHIDNTFIDSTYPDSGFGYLAPITFKAGDEQMNGTRALQFARSRHGDNNEGSDFARSLRQQKIISAFKQKILQLNIIKNAGSINELLNIFADHFHTNITPAQSVRIFNLTKGKDTKIASLSLDPDTGLICPEILASNGAYVLVPCKSADDVENYFKNSFSIGKLKAEASVVWLANSTGNVQAYNTAFRKLTNVGLRVYELGYTKDNLPDTVVYQANPKPATAEFIRNELGGKDVSLPPPGVTANKERVDVIVVLGKNAPIEAAPTPYIAPPARIATSTTDTATTTPKSTTTTSSVKK